MLGSISRTDFIDVSVNLSRCNRLLIADRITSFSKEFLMDVTKTDYDAIVVGSGPNGLAAAITIQQAGLSVLLVEAKETIGGGMRSAELTLPHFVHDVCSAIHPLAAGSPFFKTLPLEKYGLEFIEPTIPAAHPFDDGSAAALYRSIEQTAKGLGEDRRCLLQAHEPLSKELATDCHRRSCTFTFSKASV
jgi:phytoene dehydrogenase-like protein